MRYSALASLIFVAVAAATPLSPDPAGAANVGNGAGKQFITGQCLSNADCASACCATLGSIGICSGPGASTQQGKTGCGFGSGGAAAPPPPPVDNSAAPPPPPAAAPAAPASGLKPDPAGAANVGNGQGGQFITGQCLSNADCASACCATLGSIGICSGPGASTQQGKTGCGFSGGAAAPPAAAPADNSAAGAAPAAAAPPATGLKPDPAGAANVGNGAGKQFITGQCLSNADCGSACCATLGNIGICSGPGASTQQGKTGCGFAGSKRALPL